MEVGPELCFWSDSSAELNKTPLLSLSHVPVTGQCMKPYAVGGLAGVVLELESDSELEQEPLKRWDEDVINLTGTDLEDSETSSPVIHHGTDATEPVEEPVNAVLNPASPVTIGSEAKATTQSRVPNRSDPGSPAHGSVVAVDSSMGGTKDPATSLSQPVAEQSLVFPNGTSAQCPLCERTFVNFRSRNIHMNKTHSIKSSTTRTTTRKDSTRKSSVSTPEQPATTESPKPDSVQLPTDHNNTVTDTCPAQPASPTRSTGRDEVGSTTPETGSSSLCNRTPATSPAIDTPTGMIPHAYKTRPVYTVSSPTSGCPGNSGALKIRLVSVKHVKKVKHRTKSIGIAPSNHSAHDAEPLSMLTPERLEQQSHTPRASVTSSQTAAPSEMDLGEKSVQYHNTSSPEPLFQSSSASTSSPSMLSEIVQANPSALESSPSEKPPQSCTDEESLCPRPNPSSSVHRNTPFSPLSHNQSKSDASLPKSPTSTRSTPRSSSPCKAAPLPTPSPTPHPPPPSTPPAGPRETASVETASNQPVPGGPITLPLLDTTLRTSDGDYKCRVCRRLFSNRFSLTGHYKSHYDASQKPYLCDDCGQRYTSPSNLHYHRARNCPVLKLKASEAGKPFQVPSKLDKQNKQAKVPRQTIRKPPRRITAGRRTSVSNNSEQLTESMINSAEQNPLKRTHSSRTQVSNNDEPLARTPHSQSQSASNFPSAFSDTITSKVSRVTGPSPAEPAIPAQFYASLLASALNVSPSQSADQPASATSAMTDPTDRFAGLETHMKRLIEHAFQSEELHQKILALTSAALVSALNPITSAGSGNVHALFSELIRLGQTLGERTSEPAAGFQLPPPAHSQAPTQSNSIVSSWDSVGTPVTTAPRNALYSCPYCPTDLPVFADLSTLQKHVILMHSNRVESLAHPGRSDTNRNSETPKPLLPTRPLDAFLSGPYTTRLVEPGSVQSVPTQSKILVNGNRQPVGSLVQCNECDRFFATHSAYRVHHTKAHQSGSRAHRPVGLTDFDSAASTAKTGNWREICPR